tara:strand:+ start:100 stop:207 length:108 start_codon:yes stop_codon:yes gene_type:complete
LEITGPLKEAAKRSGFLEEEVSGIVERFRKRKRAK